MARWVIGWLVAGALGLVAARFVVDPERESWIVLVGGRDESVLVVDYTVSNTGVFRHQLTTRVTLLRDDASPLAHRSVAGPAALDGDGVHGALDGLTHAAGAWTWRVEGDAMRVRGALREGDAGCPGKPGRATGILDLPDEVQGHGQGVSLDGNALVVRTSTRGNDAGTALYALDNRGVVALDPRGACPGFLVLDGQPATGSPPWIPPDPEDHFELDFAGHHLEVHAGRHEYVDSPNENTLWPERLLASAVGYRVPTTVLRRARVRVDGAAPWTGLLVLRQAAAEREAPPASVHPS